MILIFKLVWIICTWIFFGLLLTVFNYVVIKLTTRLFDLILDYPCMYAIYIMKKIPVIGEWLGNCFATIVTGALLVYTVFFIHIPFIGIMLKSLKGMEPSDSYFMYR